MHAQEHVLAQFARVLGVLDHAVDHVPDQLLVARDQAFEGPGGPRQYRLHQFLVLAHGAVGYRPDGRTVAAYARSAPGVEKAATAGAWPYPSPSNGPWAPGHQPENFHGFRTARSRSPCSSCIVMAIKIVVDSRLRRRLAETNAFRGADEVDDGRRRAVARRLSALKWGLVLTLLGGAFGIIDARQPRQRRPGRLGHPARRRRHRHAGLPRDRQQVPLSRASRS